MAGKRYYSYHGYSGQRRGNGPSDGLFGWTIFMFLLIGFVFLCWMGSYYIFAHPENAGNYRLLKRLHKIESPQRFEITAAPRGEFLKPGQLLERFGPMTASEIRRSNENLLRSFLRNYHQNRDLVPYAVGTYRVIGTVPLSEKTFCDQGLVALLQAVEQPEILLEQLFTADQKNLPALQRSLTVGQEIKLEKPLDLSAVVHIDRLPDNRIRFTTAPLLYGTYGSSQAQSSFSLEPPAELNIEAGLPVLTPLQIETLSGGTLAKASGAKGAGGAGRLSRIREESAIPATESLTAKALPAKPTPRTPPSNITAGTSQPMVARAIPVNEQAVLPAIPVTQQQSLPAMPVMTPSPAAVTASATLPPSLQTALPATATPSQIASTGKPAAFPTPAGILPATPTTNAVPPVLAVTQEVWPVFSPGQMPRGRLVEVSEGNDLATRGIGGERHYLEGRFTVTASGNGRAVLRPQGVLPGVAMGSGSKVRVIVEYPAGASPPGEGNNISRDALRPFQITSVKRGDDGQVNIYAREITRGQ
jgi:hypothetical protein